MNAIQDASRFRVLIPEDRLQARIQELGAKIRSDYGDRPIVCICVLKGSFMFTADLVRAIGGALEVEFLGVSSYQGGTKTTGVVKITKDLSSPIEDKDVIIIEDIIDTGLTMHYLLDKLGARQPRASPSAHSSTSPPTERSRCRRTRGLLDSRRVRRGHGLTSPNATETSHIAVYTP